MVSLGYLLFLKVVGTRSRFKKSFQRLFSFSLQRFNMKPTPLMYLRKA